MPVGLFRGEEGWVQVDYGTGATIPVPRSKYEANGYKPDFDKLPSEAEYWAAEKKKEDDVKRPKGEKRYLVRMRDGLVRQPSACPRSCGLDLTLQSSRSVPSDGWPWTLQPQQN
jgi:hypothetical protein